MAGQVGDHLENATKHVETETDTAKELVLIQVQLTEEGVARVLRLDLKRAR